jgi:hypothetical protein
MVELYLHSPIYLQGVALNYLSIGTTSLPFSFIYERLPTSISDVRQSYLVFDITPESRNRGARVNVLC